MHVEPKLDLQIWLADVQSDLEVELKGRLPEALDPRNLSTDSRNLKAGSVYLPLVGERFDGHDFMLQAFEAGAVLAFCEQRYYLAHRERLQDLNLLLVSDSLKAYQSLARHWRRQWGRPVIAITGSSGKTSTKEILAQVLEPFKQVHRTALNYNNEIGVPKTLLELRPEYEVCLLEMGMRGLGQIRELCTIAEPDAGIITNIGPVHLSELGSQENIAQAKWELAAWLQAHQGALAVNADNLWLQRLAADYRGTLYRCGTASENEFQVLGSENTLDGQWLSYRRPDGQVARIFLDLQGEHQALNLLCCLGMAEHLGLPVPAEAEIRVPRLFGRQQILDLPGGPRLIHDAYNANPDSMRAALRVLQQQPGRHLAVLGKMAELGPEAERFHRELGAFCEELPLDQLYVIGAEARGLLEGLKTVPGQFFEDNQSAVAALKESLKPGDTVLVKASRSAGLEEVVNALASFYSGLAE